MSARVLDGKAIAAAMRLRLAAEVKDLTERLGRPPGLAVVLANDDAGSRIYVRNKRQACADAGIASFAYDLPPTASESELLALVEGLNNRPDVDGILVQTPLPPSVTTARVFAAVSSDKDVDGFNPVNQGLLLAGAPGFRPCTPAGIMDLIGATGVRVAGSKAVVVGRSLTVGRPVALLLLHAHATVTITHSRTADLAAECRAADILVVAIGKPKFVAGDWIKPGAVVIDVGINRVDGRLVGDVDYAAAAERAGWISPVPGGVGPMTIARLLANTVQAGRIHQTK